MEAEEDGGDVAAAGLLTFKPVETMAEARPLPATSATAMRKLPSPSSTMSR